MNVADIINAAMQGSASDIAVSVPDNTPAYTTEIEKLAAALDFIGANLEDSEPTFEEKLAEYAMVEEWLEKEAARGDSKKQRRNRRKRDRRAQKAAEEAAQMEAERVQRLNALQQESAQATEAINARNTYLDNRSANPQPQRRPKRDAEIINESPLETSASRSWMSPRAEAPMPEPDAPAPNRSTPKPEPDAPAPKPKTDAPAPDPSTPKPDAPDASGDSMGKKMMDKVRKAGTFIGEQTGFKEVADRSNMNRNLRRGGAVAGALGTLYGGYRLATGGNNDQKKTASLYEAAQLGKAALFEKIAEDRINPAKISAGSAAPYSGMTLPLPASEHDIVRAKAQKVRNRINAEMQQYVNNTGNGYNLQGHLNVFNQ